jgi:hypothetical protein
MDQNHIAPFGLSVENFLGPEVGFCDMDTRLVDFVMVAVVAMTILKAIYNV